jgi:5-methylcytosine-specific restriction endonuclease McrA
MNTKKCTQCGEVKPLDQFTKWSGSKDGRRSYCKACSSKYMSNYSRNTTKGRYHRLKYKAKSDGIEFNLSVQDIENLYNQTHCHYCGIELTQSVGHKHLLTDKTIDRKDNSAGYIKGNVVAACRRCNLMKGDWLTPEQTLEIAKLYLPASSIDSDDVS